MYWLFMILPLVAFTSNVQHLTSDPNTAETALIKDFNNFLFAKFKSIVSVLISFGLSAAFDTTDHFVFLKTFAFFGFHGSDNIHHSFWLLRLWIPFLCLEKPHVSEVVPFLHFGNWNARPSFYQLPWQLGNKRMFNPTLIHSSPRLWIRISDANQQEIHRMCPKDSRGGFPTKVPDAVIAEFLVVESNAVCWDLGGAQDFHHIITGSLV